MKCILFFFLSNSLIRCQPSELSLWSLISLDLQFEKLCATPYSFLDTHRNELVKRETGCLCEGQAGMRVLEETRKCEVWLFTASPPGETVLWLKEYSTACGWEQGAAASLSFPVLYLMVFHIFSAWVPDFISKSYWGIYLATIMCQAHSNRTLPRRATEKACSRLQGNCKPWEKEDRQVKGEWKATEWCRRLHSLGFKSYLPLPRHEILDNTLDLWESFCLAAIDTWARQCWWKCLAEHQCYEEVSSCCHKQCCHIRIALCMGQCRGLGEEMGMP